MRKLKHHEKKLLRGVDLYHWKGEDNLRIAKMVHRFRLQSRQEYEIYRRLCGQVTKLVNKLKTGLSTDDTFRITMTDQLLEKLYNMGVIDKTSTSLETADTVTPSMFCRRRLPVIMVRLKMAETLDVAIEYVQHGHVRVGPNMVQDPAFLVPRNLEDYITWTDSSKIRKVVNKYNNKLDDYDLI